MKKRQLKKMIGNTLHKCIALLIGLGIWHTFSNQQIITIMHTVPVCVDVSSTDAKVIGSESTKISLQGKRSDLSQYIQNQIAIHVPIEKIDFTKKRILIRPNNLFLPPEIKLVNYEPILLQKVLQTM